MGDPLFCIVNISIRGLIEIYNAAYKLCSFDDAMQKAMSMDDSFSLTEDYARDGFFVMRNYLSSEEVFKLRNILLKFLALWSTDHEAFYRSEAFNASLITGSEYLQDHDRLTLFKFIGSEKMMSLVKSVIKDKAVFMNSQLFFNPVTLEQKDFWHRDCQYDFDLEQQQSVIKETQVVHLRVPLFDEPGLELIPGTHKRWDTTEELNVRYEEQGRLSSDSLPMSLHIPLNVGDILVFSADMIHRGLYGMDRLAWDILVFDASGNYSDYIDPDCLPDTSMIARLDEATLFTHAQALTMKS